MNVFEENVNVDFRNDKRNFAKNTIYMKVYDWLVRFIKINKKELLEDLW